MNNSEYLEVKKIYKLALSDFVGRLEFLQEKYNVGIDIEKLKELHKEFEKDVDYHLIMADYVNDDVRKD